MSAEWAEWPEVPDVDPWEAIKRRDEPSGGWVRACLLGGRDPLRTLTPLDTALSGGLMPGVTVLGGRASAGKSSLACQCAASVAMAGGLVLYFTLDDSWGNVWARCASAWSCTMDAQRRGLSPFSWSHVAQERARLRGEPHPDDESRWAFEEVQRPGMARTAAVFAEGPGKNLAVVDSVSDIGEALAMAESLPEPPALMVIDYVQQYSTGDEKADATEYSRVSKVAQDVQRAALRMQMPVLELSSLRKLAKGDDEPVLDWFRGSGTVGYAAQAAVVLTPREVPSEAELAKKGARAVSLHVVKNKSGRAGHSVPALLHGMHSCMRGEK